MTIAENSRKHGIYDLILAYDNLAYLCTQSLHRGRKGCRYFFLVH
jgi:hypothetical protein